LGDLAARAQAQEGRMTDLPFHPLTELFPLIEGAEFDALVTSIKEGGQREPIVVLDGAILDGRNRYRACKAAGVEPIAKEFVGTDPIRFVVDVNMRRRHLNESQRAMIAAKLATLTRGCVATQMPSLAESSRGTEISVPPISQGAASALMNVSIDTIQSAKTVLAKGTPEEIKAAQDGKVAVSTIAKQIRANVTPEQRQQQAGRSLSAAGKNPERIENQRINAEIWQRLSEALERLSSLPNPADVAVIVRANNKRTNTLNARMNRSLQWLEEFSNEWRGSREADAA
jgi:hypothetical protein